MNTQLYLVIWKDSDGDHVARLLPLPEEWQTFHESMAGGHPEIPADATDIVCIWMQNPAQDMTVWSKGELIMVVGDYEGAT